VPNKIKKETDDILILNDSQWIILFFLLILLFLIYIYITYPNKRNGALGFGFVSFVFLVYDALNYKTVIIDRKSQRVVIKKNFLRIVNEIPFSDLNLIYIDHLTRDDDSDAPPHVFIVKLRTLSQFDREPITIFGTSNSSYAERVQRKILYLTKNSR
jgi:hypothetical protein